jgi:hypothetical protein
MIVKRSTNVADAGGEGLPSRLIDRLHPRVLIERGAQRLTHRVITQLSATETDERKSFRKQVASPEVVEGRYYLSVGEITSGTKEDNDIWIGDAFNAETRAKWVFAAALWCRLLPLPCNAKVADRSAAFARLSALHSGFTACPPN